MTPAFLLALLYPNVGKIAGMLGAVGTSMCIYVLPISTYLKMKYDGTLPNMPRSEESGVELSTKGKST